MPSTHTLTDGFFSLFYHVYSTTSVGDGISLDQSLYGLSGVTGRGLGADCDTFHGLTHSFCWIMRAGVAVWIRWGVGPSTM